MDLITLKTETTTTQTESARGKELRLEDVRVGEPVGLLGQFPPGVFSEKVDEEGGDTPTRNETVPVPPNGPGSVVSCCLRRLLRVGQNVGKVG